MINNPQRQKGQVDKNNLTFLLSSSSIFNIFKASPLSSKNQIGCESFLTV
jgi:hypothetical protein